MRATLDASALLRPRLLGGVRLVVTGAARLGPGEDHGAPGPAAGLAVTVALACAALGASVSRWQPGDTVSGDVDLLVVDAAGLFAAVGHDERGEQSPRIALSACLDGAWEATKAVASGAFIDAGRAGRIVYLAPASTPDRSRGATHADAARAGLENLARTLSIEWARYAITTVTIAPGEHTSADEIAAVTAFVASQAGAYYSGCLLDLRGGPPIQTGP